MKKLYIIHGWTYNLEKWEALSKALRQRGVEPILLKVPGLTVPSDKEWTVDDYVQWLHEQLNGVDEPIVLGHSNGGRIALKYLQRYPNGFLKLILLDSAGVPVQSSLKAIKLKFVMVLSKIAKPLKAITPLRRLAYKLLKAQDYDNASEHMKRTMSNMLVADKTIDFSQITLPVNLIWGRDDTTTPLWMGEYMQKKLPNASLHVIDGARHAPQATHVTQVADILAKIVGAKEA